MKNPKNTALPASPTSRHVAKESPGERTTVVVVRTEKRSWLALAITGFGAVLLRYIRVVRERGKIFRPGK